MGKNHAIFKKTAHKAEHKTCTPLLHKVKFALNPRALGDARLLALCF